MTSSDGGEDLQEEESFENTGGGSGRARRRDEVSRL
jgi:hypothetical protein